MTRSHPYWLTALLVWLCLALGAPAQALWNDDEPVQADKAFVFSAKVTAADSVTVRWEVTEGYYLYRGRIQLRSDTPGIT
ncbi:MAG: hypothetical protein HZB57_09840, partial [Gammaproteobacteria bacterium]|nr:hypothetical protein [Gammaproteobacteria bacterium]